ncbi:MAG TPA: hypothetical protein VNO50_16555 [Pyrinomonadaceae bacterium]|nr:hypothetical protein [Pyrinomonadaceae bacterium]
MKAVKCPNCQFVGFPLANNCKSCGRSLDLPKFTAPNIPEVSYESEETSGSRKKLLGVAALLGVAFLIGGGYFAKQKLDQYWDPTPGYVAAITSAEDFKNPVTIRVNRRQIKTSFDYSLTHFGGASKPGTAVKAADVLEAIGFLTKSIDTTVRTAKSAVPQWLPQFDAQGGAIYKNAQPTLHEVKSEHLAIQLTEKGKQEAVNWKETDEPYLNVGSEAKTIPWWRIPIGDHELVRIESVKPAPADGGVELMLITFRWRWRPNKLGEHFDPQSAAYQLMGNATQQAAATLKWDSKTEYLGHATLLKRGDKWEVTDLKFMNEESAKSVLSGMAMTK